MLPASSVQRPRVPQTASPFLALAALVLAGDAGVVHHRHRRGAAGDVREDQRLVRGLLELPGDAHAEHAVLRVGEHDAFAGRRQRRDPIDRPGRRVAGEYELRALAQQTLPSGVTQSSSVLSSPRSARRPCADTIRRWRIVPIFDRSVGLIASELFQKSRPLTHLVVEPQADVVRMIDALARRAAASGHPRVTIVPPALRIGSSTGFLDRAPGQMYDVNGLPPMVMSTRCGHSRSASQRPTAAPRVQAPE